MLRLGAPRAVTVLGALTLSTFTYVTTETLPIGLLTSIADDLRASWSAVGLLVSGYGLVVVVATIPLTRATHRPAARWPACSACRSAPGSGRRRTGARPSSP